MYFKKFMKKVIIIKKFGRLANQLWLYISVYAYCLERGYDCDNWAFYEYERYFPNIKTTNLLIRLVIEKLLIFTKRKTFVGNIFNKYIRYIKNKSQDQVIGYHEGEMNLSSDKGENLVDTKIKEHNKVLLDSWLFRDAVAIEKYRAEIKNKFKPKEKIEKKLDNIIKDLRAKYDKIIGVHIRQGDYRYWKDGIYYFPPESFNVVLEDFRKHLSNQKICFVICSDEDLKKESFPSINVIFGPGDLIEDLFILSKTDLIIGSNSTFGAFASYYGDIPFKVIKKNEDYNWDYYLNKNGYFKNKDCTAVVYY